MSYPGGNGFSLANKDLNTLPHVRQLLSEASGRGFLLQRKHTPKMRVWGESKKWYPHPILVPYYELTLNQTKEPYYLNAADVEKWLARVNVEIAVAPKDHQMTLPLDLDSDT